MGIESPKAESRDVPKKDFFNQPQVKKLEEIRDETNHVKQTLQEEILTPEVTNKQQTDREMVRSKINEKLNSLKISLEGLETIDDLRKLSIDQLFSLENQYEGILFYAFTDFKKGSDKVNFNQWKTWYRNPTEGEQFTIHFYGNLEAENKLGAADILPPEVRKITVFQNGDPSRARTSIRRIGLKGRKNKDGTGFFDKHGYIPIYSDDLVIVGDIKKEEFAKYRQNPTPENLAHDKPGQLNYELYEQDQGSLDQKFILKLPTSAPRSKADYQGMGSLDRKKLGLEKNLNGQSLNQALREQPDLYFYAHRYRLEYARKSGIDIPENIMFAIMKRESGFGVDRMNAQGSQAAGLFQFLPGTWNQFLKENSWAIDKLDADPVWRYKGKQEWRFNPEIMIAAGYWYATSNLKNIYRHRDEFQGCKKFLESTLGKPETGENFTLQETDSWILYLAHHDGLGGAKRLLRYQALRDNGVEEEVAARKANLCNFQKWQIESYKPLRFKRPHILVADAHWDFLVNNPNQGSQIVQTALAYKKILNVHDLPTQGTGWGWAKNLESIDLRDLEASQIRLIGDSLLVDAGKNLRIKGQPIPEARDNDYVKKGKSIVDMNKDLGQQLEKGKFENVESVAIIAGANDLAGKSADFIIAQMQILLNSLNTKNPKIRVTLVTLPPVSGYTDNKHFEPKSCQEKVTVINQWIRNKAKGSKQIGCVDIYAMAEDPSRPGYMKKEFNGGDGLHLSSFGNKKMREALEEELLKVETRI